jgi:hypothetical protein
LGVIDDAFCPQGQETRMQTKTRDDPREMTMAQLMALHRPNARLVPGLLRQGDVLLRPVNRLPIHAQPAPDQRTARVLSTGRNGHAHVLSNGQVFTAVHDEGTRTFVQIEEPATLTHDEHGPIEVPAGTYEVVLQREFVPPEPQQPLSSRIFGEQGTFRTGLD